MSLEKQFQKHAKLVQMSKTPVEDWESQGLLPETVGWLLIPESEEHYRFCYGVVFRPSPESIARMAQKGVRFRETKPDGWTTEPIYK